MPAFIEVPDRVASPDGVGRIRVDRRPAANDSERPPLVLLGGMTQTLTSWSAHVRPLSKHREVIVYEARGQGSTELSSTRCGPQEHVEDLIALLDALGLGNVQIDLSGFSFGGRVALAFAANHPQRLRSLVLSGVALDRGIVGRLIVQGWISTLRTGDLESLARVSLPDILGPAYLAKHAEMIDAMVKASTTRNRFEGIAALFEQMLELAADSPWQPEALAGRVQTPALVMGGALDRLAPPAEVAALAQALNAQHRTFDDVGHTVAIEAAQPWREAVEAFLDR